MKIIAIIPSRYGSTRFPGKPLALIKGKTLVQRVYERVKKSNCFDRVIIATDNYRILKEAKKINADVMMTAKTHQSGTDRIAEAAKKLEADIVVNVQGDEPVISLDTIRAVVDAIKRDPKILMATPVCGITDKKEINNPNIVKVTLDKNMFALYFSRSPIPYNGTVFYKHIGLYAYRKNFLLRFVKMQKSLLESTEKLEQLRVLENGYKIKAVLVKDDSVPVDVPGDINKVLKLLKNDI